MKMGCLRRTHTRHSEAGQAMLWTIVGMSVFLLGAMAFAVDLSYLWFDRQSAQTAADAACTAGAMDLLVDATNGTTTMGGFTAGTAFDCSSNATAAPCKYANLNGYNSSLTQANANAGTIGNNVFVDFPANVPGVTAPPPTVAPTAFMSVTVTSNVPTFFGAMLQGLTKQSIRAVAKCGVAQAAAPIPILVLDPNSPASNPPLAALNIQGSGNITIFGGPSRSIQVNSSASAGSCGASNCSNNLPWGSEQIDLSQAGPLGNGADIGLSGAPTAAPGGFLGGTSGHWLAPVAPIMDPFAQVCYPGQTTNCNATINGFSAPSVPPLPLPPADEGAARFPASPCTSIPCRVGYRDHGCPDPAATRLNTKCLLYTAGSYPAGIPGGGTTNLLDPGLYYVTGGVSLGAGSTIRPGTGDGDGSGGVTIYLNGTGTVQITANSGTQSGLDDFNTLTGPVDSTGTQYPDDATHKNVTFRQGVKCDNTSVVPTRLLNGGAGLNIGSDATNSPAIRNGANLLLGPCSGYYGDPLGASEPASIGLQRWFLFFQDRSATGLAKNSSRPQFTGTGQLLVAGTMYFHSCNSSGSGVGCIPPPVPATNSSYYQDIFQIQGNSASGTYVLGEIVTDNLMLGGGGAIRMFLNPTTAFNILKASLYQ